MKITDYSPENRPRERLAKEGPHALSNAELLALILKSGTKKENIIELCNKLLAKYSLKQLSQCTLVELTHEHGIGLAKASQLLAVFELYQRIPSQQSNSPIIRSAKDISTLFLPKLSSLNKEHFLVVYLDTKNRIIKEETISIGTLNSSLIHPREVFHGAIKHCANSIIVIHNHPSGDPTPSSEDLEVTTRLQQSAQILNIKFLDHIIIGKTTWWSWRESIN